MALSMLGIEKSFNANRVLKNVDFALEKGEIRALIGENGAGKTTLMNILGGVLKADRGTIRIDGREVVFHTPRDSMSAGVAFIHQELNLVNDLNIYENFFLGREIKKHRLLDKAGMIRVSREVLSRLDLTIDPRTSLRSLDASYKQIVEIARALLMDARIIIMDEPTSSLTETEIRRVFALMRMLQKQGVSIIFISHKLKEVLAICDTFTVLRDGEKAREGSVKDTDERMLARWMVGHEIQIEQPERRQRIGSEALRVEGLTWNRAYRNISFTLRSGEILGFTGLLGDGRSELLQTVFGCNPDYQGDIYINGKVIRMTGTSKAYRAGIGYVPRDRKENGILKDLSILQNGSIVTYRELTDRLLINSRRERANMQKNVRGLSIKTNDLNDLITSLSGGNQQKVVLAKWLSASPRILVFDNPTQGVDVGAKEEIYDIILRLSETGVAIVILSSESQEIIRLCDRAIILYHGAIRGELRGKDMTEEKLMILATGGTLENAAESKGDSGNEKE